MRRWALAGPAVVLFAVALPWAGWAAWSAGNANAALEAARVDLVAGRPALAARALKEVLAHGPEWDRAWFLLGLSEKQRGRTHAALEAWKHVGPGSSFALAALQGRMMLLFDAGRLGDAERLVLASLADARTDRFELSSALARLYYTEGRADEANHLLEAAWGRLNQSGQAALEPAVQLLRLHVDLSMHEMPLETARAFLEKAERSAPDDDRVALGLANLSTRAGRPDDAARRLDACSRRRPSDVPVLRARLNWAVAAGREAEARAALKRLPAGALSTARAAKLDAWFAARRNDENAERQALERCLAAAPTDDETRGRLIEILTRAGQKDRAKRLRAEQDEIARAQKRYQELYARYQPRRDAAEMAGLAQLLGRPFEARAFQTIARDAEQR